MDNKKKKYDKEEAKEARKAELDEISEKLEKGIKAVFEGENYKKYLEFCSRFPKYSINNQILIMLQRPDATMCQSFTAWKNINRSVKKGEKGIRILAPAPFTIEKEKEKHDEDGNWILNSNGEPEKETVKIVINAFKPVSTFDISQTEGDPVPELGIDELKGDVKDYDSLLRIIKDIVPVPVEFEDIKGGAKGYFNTEENRIAIKSGMSEVQTIKTLLHEASHQALHSKEAEKKDDKPKSTAQKEVEAESVAYIVCKYLGIETSDYSFVYLATWSKDQEVPELRASLDTIRKTSSDMIEKIKDKLTLKAA